MARIVAISNSTHNSKSARNYTGVNAHNLQNRTENHNMRMATTTTIEINSSLKNSSATQLISLRTEEYYEKQGNTNKEIDTNESLTSFNHLQNKPKESNKSGSRVCWDESTVDNEFMNKRKSKKCCIYHKPKQFGESSSEDDSESEEICSYNNRKKIIDKYSKVNGD
ncbi:protein phosphatase inhibitor, putative [Cryptosporidium muris RN66]|uniref:Protein phosphatase inhibitor, putative n=1 Tax=Cryptosporidium muris (strain RN66) TaxID=441375 RepID=B6AK42_CRYMR|nr:protein phosphatase inhibitor, putative [Cryptosporidium muris RN66]EEA08583.1 protein phosphatase inhibitor, putative [Cryptosporidium muris RN66]|eukprot:XP_002142932.1 protein phosphatase inhibitor [Cryptosporidium muris RN66]